MKIITPTFAAALAIVAGCAPVSSESPTVASAAGSEARQCLHVPSVNGFKAVDDDTVNVRAGVNDVYQLDLLGDCRDIDWNNRIALRSRGGGSFSCGPLGLEVISPTSVGAPDVCPVTAMRKLSDAEVAALPRENRP